MKNIVSVGLYPLGMAILLSLVITGQGATDLNIVEISLSPDLSTGDGFVWSISLTREQQEFVSQYEPLSEISSLSLLINDAEDLLPLNPPYRYENFLFRADQKNVVSIRSQYFDISQFMFLLPTRYDMNTGDQFTLADAFAEQVVDYSIYYLGEIETRDTTLEIRYQKSSVEVFIKYNLKHGFLELFEGRMDDGTGKSISLVLKLQGTNFNTANLNNSEMSYDRTEYRNTNSTAAKYTLTMEPLPAYMGLILCVMCYGMRKIRRQ